MHEEAIDYLTTAARFAVAVILAVSLIWLFPDKHVSIFGSLPLAGRAESDQRQTASE
jgi:hypothetical protein